MIVLGLLGVLAYGSFAFGKYVLSAKLFGDNEKTGALRTVSRSTDASSAVTRQTGWKGSKPRVDVKVLPANQTSLSPDTSEYVDEDSFKSSPSRSKTSSKNDEDQPSRTTTRSPSIDSPQVSTADKPGTIKRNVDDTSVEYSLGSERRKRSDDAESRPRKRRRRSRSTREKVSTNRNRNRETTRTRTQAAPTRTDSAPTGDGRESTSSRGDDAATSVTSGNSASRERVRERPRGNTSSSPIPRPESSGSSSGGDSASISPVPQPE